jgi:Tfp pilus assembly protein PilV
VKQSRNTECGTTLVEVLVALLLLAIGVLGITPLFISSTDVSAAGGELGHLSTAAATRFETLRAAPFYMLAAGGSLTTDVTLYSDTSNPASTIRWEIIDGPSGTKTITVRALSTGLLPGRRSISLTTLRSR